MIRDMNNNNIKFKYKIIKYRCLSKNKKQKSHE